MYFLNNPLRAVLAVSFIMLMTLQCSPTEPPPAEEAESDTAAISISEPRARLSNPNGAIYFMLENQGAAADTLLSASTDIAETVELHETTIDENDVMQMSPMENVPLPVGEAVLFEPGGKHVMLLNLQQELAVGDTINLTLNFEEAEPLEIEVPVTEAMEMNMDHMEDDMEEMDDMPNEHDGDLDEN